MHNLFDEIISLENLFLAWNKFSRGKKEKEDVGEFSIDLENNIFSLQKQLLNDMWEHSEYQNFKVCDPKFRQIHKAKVIDRIVHQAIFNALEPIFDKSFIFDSWSSRKGKGTHKSVLRLHKKLEEVNKRSVGVWVLKCDIRKFFKNVNQNILLRQIKRKITDKKVLRLVEKIIFSFPVGLPLGNLTSQLFANIYFDQFDHFVKEKLKIEIYLRYSDDFILVSDSKEKLMNSLKEIKNFLHDKLNLELHNEKIIFRKYHWGVDWLGFILYPGYRIMRMKTKMRMNKNVNRVVNSYLKNEVSYNSLCSVFASYSGILEYSWEKNISEYLQLLKKVL